MKKKIALPNAIGILLLSTFLISGGGYALIRIIERIRFQRLTDERYFLTQLIQTGPKKEALKSVYLQELLKLSKNKPLSFFEYDSEKAEKTLLTSPLIEEARVKKIPPHTLYVDYSLREPFAILYDFENTFIDQNGALFPIHPFFSPKKIPEIYLGLAPFDQDFYDKELFYKQPLKGAQFELALEVIQILSESQKEYDFFLKRVDLSLIQEPSVGRQELIILIENRDSSLHYLRLPVEKWEEQLNNYLILREKLAIDGQNRTIDLRLHSLGYIEEVS
ncbi:MAG: FtsQ-type POTRA domain-containing protein [Simkaniaceae bacterium]